MIELREKIYNKILTTCTSHNNCYDSCSFIGSESKVLEDAKCCAGNCYKAKNIMKAVNDHIKQGADKSAQWIEDNAQYKGIKLIIKFRAIDEILKNMEAENEI